MERVNAICRHPLFLQKMTVIEREERERIYCRHGISHLMDTARLMYIRALEEGIHIPKDVLYAAALLHDIGRADSYESGLPHDEAGAETAGKILPDCGYSDTETEMICCAIRGHRGFAGQPEEAELPAVLKDADKRSRLCFCCNASDTCKWPEEKKNMEIDT